VAGPQNKIHLYCLMHTHLVQKLMKTTQKTNNVT